MMVQYSKAQPIETVMTFSEWEKIHNRKKSRKRAEAIYYIKQKLMGLAAVGISVASPLLLDGDATISVLMLPLGLFLMVTKEKICMF